MITTADWLRYIESLGPSDDDESMRMRLESAGADPALAGWLLSIDRQRRVAQKVARIATLVVLVGIVWTAYQWTLALRGASNAPEINDAIPAAVVLATGALAMLIASGVELSPPLDLVHPTIPSDLTPPPRQVGVSLRTGAARRMALAMFCFMLAPFALAVTETRNRVWLARDGVETTGHVTDVYTRKGSKGRTDYYARYEFDHGTGVRSLRRAQFGVTNIGDTVPVTYLPSRPRINRAETKAQLQSSFWVEDPVLVIAFVYLLLIAPAIAIAVGYGVRRQRQLAERGVAVLGEVTGARRQMIEYRYLNQRGRFMYGKRRLRERPVEGQPLVILYDPDKPKRSAPLGAISDFELR